MGKRKVWQRLLAVVLALSMICSTQTMSVFADIVGYSIQNNAPAATPGETDPENVGGGDETSAFTPTETKVINQQGIITADTVNLREQPTTESNSLAALAKDTAVTAVNLLTIPGDDLKWYEVQTAEGTKGYIREDLMALTETEPQEQEEENEINLLNEGEENTAADTAAKVKELADTYFPAGASNYQQQLSVSLAQTGGGSEIKAGQELSYEIRYTTKGSPLYGYDTALSMFDEYTDISIRVELPDGIVIEESQLQTIVAQNTNITAAKKADDGNAWIFTLAGPIDASYDRSNMFSFNAKVAENGAVEVGKNYSYAELDISMTASFQVLNKVDASNPVEIEGAKYTQTAETDLDSLGTLTATSGDTWKVEKELVKDTAGKAYTVNADDTVTVHYLLKVGMAVDGYALSDTGAYTVNGRAPFAGTTITISDTPVVTGRDGNAIAPTKAVVTPQFGNKTPILYDTTGGKTVEEQLADMQLPYNTSSAEVQAGGVDAGAPYYSTYKVDITYPDYTENFVASYNDENQSLLPAENTATLTYQLKGTDTPVTTQQVKVETAIGEVTRPAKLTISKEIQNRSGVSQGLYRSGVDWGNVSGPAVITVTRMVTDGNGGWKEDTDSTVTLYKKEGNTYTPVSTDGTIKIDPKDATGEGNVSTTGTVTLYLDAGTYKITETGYPANTVAVSVTGGSDDDLYTLTEGGSKELTFVNKETLGAIVVTKTGTRNGSTAALQGVTYELYGSTGEGEDVQIDKNNKIGETQTTDTNGQVTFDDLVPGTYFLVETGAPEGYLVNSEPVKVTVALNDTNNNVVTVTQNNKYNEAWIKLQKQYWNYISNQYENVNSSNYTTFNGFTLERSTDGTNWETVSNVSVALTAETGAYEVRVPVYQVTVNEDTGEVTKTPYQYRFREVLPEGWHPANDADEETENGVRVAYSATLELDGKEGTGRTTDNDVPAEQTATMLNTREGELTLTKNVVTFSTGRKVNRRAAEEEFSFDLYRQEGNDPATYVGNYSTDANGQIKVDGLNVNKVGGKTVTYWWVEQEKEGFVLETATQELQTEANGTVKAFKAGEFTNGYTFTASVTATNVEQKALLKIVKQDSYTNEYVAGAKVTVTDATSQTVSGRLVTTNDDGTITVAETAAEIQDAVIPSGGLLYVVEPGTYTVKETTVPQGYTCEEESYTAAIPEKMTSSSDVVTVTVKNIPDPTVTVKKMVDGAAVDGVEFEVYTATGEGENMSFARAKDTAGNDATITSGTNLQIPKGTYYLKEVPSTADSMKDVLFPDKYPALYEGEGVEKDGAFYFGPFEVKDSKEVQTVTITNLENKGSVTGLKVDGSNNNAPLARAIMGIFTRDAEGDLVPVTNSDGTNMEAESDTNGKFSFEDLPVYNSEGKLIEYVIKEVETPQNTTTRYTLSKDEIETTLKPDETITTVNGETGGQAIQISNLRTVTFTVIKNYRNIWEYQFTQKDYRLSGVKIALYSKEQDEDVYKPVMVKNEDGEGEHHYIETTDNVGQVTFENLDQTLDYIAVEVRIPTENGGIYTYLQPAEGEIPETVPERIAVNDLKDYNVVSRPGGTSSLAVTETLSNEKHWAQIRVFKYDNDPTHNLADGTRKPVSGSHFALYKEVVDEEPGSTLSFDEADCELVGTYISGTLTDEEGNLMDGWFATDILDAADNVVYWLVETKAAPGYEIIPDQNPVLFYNSSIEDKGGYINNSEYGSEQNDGSTDTATSTVTATYTEDTIVEYEKPNRQLEGPGAIHSAVIRLAKWAGKMTANNEKDKSSYTPLGNVTYEIWLTDEDGNLLFQVDTVTTGLENDGTSSENPTAMAISYLYYEWIRADYAEANDIENVENAENALIKDGIAYEDGDDIIVRMALREVSAPVGYGMSVSPNYMLVRYKKAALGTDVTENPEAESTETVNDAFFVTGSAGSEPLADEITVKDTWASNENKVRLVNWPSDFYAVTVSKYGYAPNEDTINQTAEKLDRYFEQHMGDRSLLVDVEMKLQKRDPEDGEWKDYDYKNLRFFDEGEDTSDAKFKTESTGSYTFPRGLTSGTYRVIETGLGGNTDYEMLYGEGTAGRTFVVTDDNLNVSMYNPEKVSLSIAKEDMVGNKVNNWTFTLTEVGGSAAARQTNGNVTTFANVSTGNYCLTESGFDYSIKFLTEYLESLNVEGKTQISNLTSDGGIFLGITTGTAASGEPIVTGVTDLSDYGFNGTLTIKNPQLGTLTVQKYKEGTSDGLPGATFTLYQYLFDSLTDAVTVDTSVALEEAETLPKGWSKVTETKETAAGGTASWTNLEPGVYYVVETKAPTGYELDPKGQYVVLTGGMSVNVTAAGASDTDASAVTATFYNKPQANLRVTKAVSDVSDLRTDKEKTDDTFTFRLYKGKDDTKPQTITIKDGESGTFSNLSLGQTYYLEEAEDSDYALTGLTLGGTSLTAGEDGRYEIAITKENSGETLEVTATNTYLYAKVTILKVDKDHPDVSGLAGAAFEITGPGLTQPVPMTAGNTDTTKGHYTATVKLAGTEAATYTITETKAPDNYTASAEPITVTLKPGDVETFDTSIFTEDADGNWVKVEDSVMRQSLIMPNSRGVNITVTKFDNLHDATNKAPLKDVTFTLYHRKDDKAAWNVSSTAVTGADGKATFYVAGGEQYALVETVPDGYFKVDGIYSVAGDQETALSTVTFTPSGSNTELTGYLVSEEILTTGDFYYNAYNVPKVSLKVTKEDVSGASVVPEANVSVYKVDETTAATLTDGQELTESQISDITKNNAPVATKWTTEEEGSKTYTVFEGLEQGATYLVVENQTQGHNGAEYNTLIKADNRVVWYDVVKIPADAKEQQLSELKNVLGQIDLTLEKESSIAADTALPSLYEKEQDITYTLTPNVTNKNYPLDGFVLEDEGLTAYNAASGGTALAGALEEQYSITEVTLGQASHTVSHYMEENRNAPINAVVTFYEFNGTPHESDPVCVSDSALDTVTAASVAENANIKIEKISISYSSDALTDAKGYALGADFNPGQVQVKVHLKQLENPLTAAGGEETGGAGEENAGNGENADAGTADGAESSVTAADQIRRIENKATATLSYHDWNNVGQQIEADDLNDNDTAVNKFDDARAPKISIKKELADTKYQTVDLGGQVEYLITVKNEEAEGGPSLSDPVIIDLLPQGVSVEEVSAEETFAEIISPSDGFSIERRNMYRFEENMAAVMYLTGELKAGESVTLKLTATVNRNAASYGNTMTNYAFVTSIVPGIQNADNPNGSAFKDNPDQQQPAQWAPTSLATAAKAVGVEDTRAEAFAERLAKAGLTGYGYLGEDVSSNWRGDSGMILLKENKGDRDTDGYQSGRLARASRDGYVDYRITLGNTSGQENRDHLKVLDVLPAKDDIVGGGTPRYSNWNLEFGEILSVSAPVTGADGTTTYRQLSEGEYKVYYTSEFTGHDAVIEASFDKYPANWTATKPDTVEAFMVVLDENITLKDGQQMVVEFRTNVPEKYETDDSALMDVAFSNAVNDFQAHFYSYGSNEDAENAEAEKAYMNSNAVSATLLPEEVQVGGHIWIDADADGNQTGEYKGVSGSGVPYFGYDIVKQMLGSIKITLNTYDTTAPGKDVGTADTAVYGKGGSWMTDAEYTFTGLDAARLTTEEGAYVNGELQPSKLRGTNPATYMLVADMTGVTGKFGVTPHVGSGISRDPSELYTTYSGETTDNNYTVSSQDNIKTLYSERFFLYPSTATDYDHTKDLGLVLYRDLNLTKEAADDPNTPVEGATFAVYGPFNSDEEARNADLNSMQPKWTGKTGSDGTVTFSDLLWFKAYVIVETSTAPGYELAGAEATSNTAEGSTEIGEVMPEALTVPNQDGTTTKCPGWVLGIPGTQSTVETEDVTVTNIRKTTVELEASKDLTKKDLTAGAYEFQLLNNEGKVLQTKANDAEGNVKFDAEELTRVGTHTFYIKEVLPKDPENEGEVLNKKDGILYDETVYTVTVTTQWIGNQLTVAEKTYSVNGTEAPNGAQFTNRYEAAGTWQLAGDKNLTGRYQKDEEFTFNLVETKENGEALPNAATYTAKNAVNSTDKTKGTFTFDEISYTKNETVDQTGDHYYLIEEDLNAGNGLSANSQQFLVKVTVTDNGDGTLTATTTEVKERSGADGTWTEVADKKVEFENTYTSSGSDALDGSKTVSGGPLRNFTFGIYTDAGCSKLAVDAADVTENAALTKRVSENQVSVSANQDATRSNFGFTVYFTEADITDKENGTGTVILYVKEEGAADDNATTNDTSVFKVEYSLKDNGAGTITATPAITEVGGDGSSIAFENRYAATGSVELKAKKVLTGRNFAADEFTFQLLDAEENELQTKKVPAATVADEENKTYSAEVAFDPVTYDMDDLTKATGGYEDEKTFTYYIVEEAGTATGVTYSKAKYKVEVTVTDNGTGTLAVSDPVITQILNDLGVEPENGSVEEATFTNDFKASGSVTLKAAKNLKGQTLSDGQFTFTLTDVTEGLADADKVSEQTATNTGTAVSFVLENVYDQDDAGKTFTYEIREKNDGKDGYTYSGAVYRAKVTVSLNEDKTGLDTEVTYEKYNAETEEWDTATEEEVTFVNFYKASGSATINGTKTVTYRDTPVGPDEFTFLLKEGDTEIAQIKTEAGGGFSYEFKYEITEETTDKELAALLGEHTYTLTEVTPELDEKDPNMLYSGQKYTIKITVDDNDRNGELNVSAPAVTDETGKTAEAITFTNTYQAKGEATLNITKNLIGNRAEGIGENEFSFTVTLLDEAGNETGTSQTVQIPAAEEGTPYTSKGTVTFSYDQTDLNADGSGKTYWYKISENTSAAVSVAEDTAVYYAKVVLSNSGKGDGEIVSAVTYHTAIEGEALKAEDETLLTGVTFTNSYTAEGKAQISGNKKLTGNRNNKENDIKDQEFQFQVVKVNADETEEVVGYAYNDAKGDFTVEFGKELVNGDVVNFTQADIGQTFTNYVLREVIPAEGEEGYKASIDYDETTYPLTVTVADSKTEKGKLAITVTRADGKTDTPQFTNKYLATGTGSISGTKELTGNRLNTGAVNEGEFTFQVLDENNKIVGTAVNDGQGNFTINEIYKTVSEDDNGNEVNVPFDQDDIREEAYTEYTLVEVDKADTETTGITYDKTTYPLTITVSDKDGQGNLDVKVELDGEAEAAEFKNDYHAAGTGVIELKKSLTGRPTGLSDGEFEFEIYEENADGELEPVMVEVVKENEPVTTALIASNDADGNIRFELSYDETDQGTHTYVIKEIDTGDPNITYDGETTEEGEWKSKEIQVTVEVKDNGNGTMAATTTYPNDITFDNSYTAKGSVAFTGWKYVLGNRAAQVEENEFTFTVKEKMADGTEVKVATGWTVAGGKIEFTDITYNQDHRNNPADPDDVHTYLIYEDKGQDGSITYETEPVTVTVKVTDAVDENGNYVEGQLAAEITYPTTEDDINGVVFKNQYNAEGSITLEGTKELLGNRAAALEDGEFTFEVRELDENGVPGQTDVTTGESKADGTIDFEPIEYKVEAGRSDIGTHTYEIREVAGTDETVDYTDTVFTVTVEVTDLGSGDLDAQVVQEESQTMAFQNQYRAAGELTLDNFSKALDGSALEEGQFTFQLTDEAGNVLQTVTNGPDGSIAFEPLTYDQDDIGQEFVYTVSEVNTGVNGITYDETVYTVRVTVEDSETSDGNLVVTPTVLNGSSVVEPAEGELLPAVTFENAFDGSVTLTKQGADGRNLAGAQFTLYAATGQEDAYEIYAAAENPQGIYTTDENGQLTVTGLPANTYYFVETQAPAGYAIETDANGDPVKYEFTIGVEDGTTAAVVNAALTVIDPLATTGSIQVTKRLSTLDADLNFVDFVANNETYYVGIFTDAAGTQPYGTDYIRSISMDGIAVSEPVTFDGLTSGTYYILETDAAGNPIPMNEMQTMNAASFYCQTEEESSNMVTLDLTADDRPGLVRLQNVYMDLPDGYYWEASLNITKRVLRNGEEATVDDTFYAGVFNQLEDGSYELLVEVELLQNDTVTVSGLGGPVDGTATFYVFETDGNGNPVSDDPAFGYSVDGEGSVTVTEQNTTGAVTITNSFEEEETTTTTTTTTTTSGSGTATGKSTANVKTGDDTNLMPYLAMMVLAAAAAAGVLVYRKRRREDEEEI